MANPGSFLTAPKLQRATPQAVTPKATPTPMAKPSMGALGPAKTGPGANAQADYYRQQMQQHQNQMGAPMMASTAQPQYSTMGAPQQFNQMGAPMMASAAAAGRTRNDGGGVSSLMPGQQQNPGQTSSPSFQLPAWNPPAPPAPGDNGLGSPNGSLARTRMPDQNEIPGQAGGFFGGRALYDPNQYGSNDSIMAKYISNVLPVATFDQNNYQYAHDANEAQRRYNLDHGLAENQNQFQQGLSARQQMSAEEQARVAAQQWGQQFQHTSNMDMLGYGISQGQLADQQQQTQNTGQYQQGINQNQAFANNANAQFQQGQNQNQSYANTTDRRAQGATQQYQQGLVRNQNFANTTDRYAQGATAQYQQGLIGNQANLNNMQNQYWQGQNANDQYANKATATYQQGLVSNQGYANKTDRSNVNNQFLLGKGANQNQAQANSNQLQLGMGNIGVNQQANTIQQAYNSGQISLGNRNAALAELTQGQNNSFLQQQLAQQAQQAGLDRQAQIQMANIGAYGRSQAPQASWAHNWG